MTSTFSRMRALTSVVLAPSALMMSTPTASRPLNCADVRGSSAASLATAMSPRRISRPPRWATTSRPKSAGLSRRPRSRMVRSVDRLVDAADRRGQVLRLQRLDHLADADAGGLQRLRIELDGQLALDAADDADLGDAADAAQLVGDAGIDDAGQLRPGQRRRGQRQLDDREVVRIEAGQDRLLHLLRQIVADLRDAVADVLGRFLQVLREVELDGDDAEAVERVRLDLLDAADRGDLLLDRIDDLALDGVRRRARIGDRHRDDRRRHLGELVGVEAQQGEDAEDRDGDHHHDGHDRPFDGEIRDGHAGGSRPVSSTTRPAA